MNTRGRPKTQVTARRKQTSPETALNVNGKGKGKFNKQAGASKQYEEHECFNILLLEKGTFESQLQSVEGKNGSTAVSAERRSSCSITKRKLQLRRQ